MIIQGNAPNKELLESGLILFNPLQKVEIVINANNSRLSCAQVRPGSIGYVGYVGNNPGDRINMQMHICFIRHGKTGKPRISKNMIRYIPFDMSKLSSDERDKIKNIYGESASFKLIEAPSKDIRHMTEHEFIGYITAFSMFLSLFEPAAMAFNSQHALDHYLPRLNDMDIILFCRFISFINNQYMAKEAIESHFNSTLNRSIFMEKAHKALVSSKRGVQNYLSINMRSADICKENILAAINPQEYKKKKGNPKFQPLKNREVYLEDGYELTIER